MDLCTHVTFCCSSESRYWSLWNSFSTYMFSALGFWPPIVSALSLVPVVVLSSQSLVDTFPLEEPCMSFSVPLSHLIALALCCVPIEGHLYHICETPALLISMDPFLWVGHSFPTQSILVSLFQFALAQALSCGGVLPSPLLRDGENDGAQYGHPIPPAIWPCPRPTWRSGPELLKTCHHLTLLRFFQFGTTKTAIPCGILLRHLLTQPSICWDDFTDEQIFLANTTDPPALYSSVPSAPVASCESSDQHVSCSDS